MAGTLDTTFGTGAGIVITSFNNNPALSCTFTSSQIQQDGKIIVAGGTVDPSNVTKESFGVARYNTNGTLDTSFGSSGFAHYNYLNNKYTSPESYGLCLILDSSQNIIIGGTTTVAFASQAIFCLAKFTSNGVANSSFLCQMISTSYDLNGIQPLIMSNKNIILAGRATDNSLGVSYSAIACYNTDGSLNIGWGQDSSGLSVFIDPSLNGSFYTTCAAIQTIGATEYVIIGGFFSETNDYTTPTQMAMVRIRTSNGSLDTTFGQNGYKYSNFTDVSGCAAYSIVIKSDNTILLGGFSVDYLGNFSFAMAHFQTNGTIDTSFGTNGLVTSQFPSSNYSVVYSIALQSDGKIILGGYTTVVTTQYYALARYNSNGIIDTTFGSNGFVNTFFSAPSGNSGKSINIQTDGKIVLAGLVLQIYRPSGGGRSENNGAIGVARYNSTDNITCFKEDTKILCFKDGEETYIPIQHLRPGDLVKTLNSGYVKIDMIGKSTMENPGTDDRIKDRLYVLKNNNYPEVFEDLYITGCHSILVDHLSDCEREKTLELLNDIFVTEGKYRLMACVDEKSIPYNSAGQHTIYHIALENEYYYRNYGIYANGLLVETTSKRWLKELSGMELL